MKALILCGSSHKGGCTEAMCRTASDALRSVGWSCTILGCDNIAHCTGCGECTDGRCHLADGMDQIYAEFSKADLMVLSSPVHFSGPSSLIKTVIDRFQPYWFRKDLPHPEACIGLLCAGSDDPEYSPTLSVFRAFSAMLGMRWVGHVEVSGTDRNGTDGAEEKVREFMLGISRG